MRSGCPSEDVAGGRHSDGGQCTCTDGQVADYFCKLCQALICGHCKSTKHRHHDSQTVHVVAGDMRNNIQKYDPENLKTEKMDSLLNATQLIKEMKTDLFALQMHEIDRIDERLNELHKELDGIHSKLVGKVMDIVRKDAEYLNREERILNRTAASITRMCDEAKHLMTEADDIDVIRRGYSVCEEMDETLQVEITTPVKGQAFFLEFIPGGREHSRLEEMFGDISVQSGNDQADTQTPKHSQPTMSKQLKKQGPKSKVTMMKFVSRVTVPVADHDIWGVCATADKCWFTDCSRDIKLVDKTGTLHRTVTVGVGCTGLTTDGSTMYVTSFHDRSIKKILTDHKVTNKQTSLSFSPVGLTFVPVTGELLVCGRKTDGVFSVTGSGVQRTLTGVMFQDAYDTAVNNNGDICVTDGNKVFIFNSDKRHIGTYDGHGTSIQNEMDARGVTCDSRGYFIIADNNNNVFHFINRDGDNVSIYDTTEDCKEQPRWIDISPSSRLWVSFGHDKICVYDMI